MSIKLVEGLHGHSILHRRGNWRAHNYDHNVSESDVEQVMRGSGEDLPAKNGARMKLGQTATGRYLQVIYVPDQDQIGIFVITAYELRGKARTAFRRRRRRKPR